MTANPASIPLRGVIEGFYGKPWPAAARALYAHWLADLGLNCYLYAPKADPYLRRSWASHWPDAQWQSLYELAGIYRAAGVAFGVGLSPFSLYADYSAGQRQRLRQKIDRLNALEMPVLALLFDDMPGDQMDLAARQADIIIDCLEWTQADRLLVCPTYYSDDPVLERVFGKRPPGYWKELGAALPDAVDLFWTGNRVCAEQLQMSDVRTINDHVRRPVTLWDNYPVNDGALRSRHLYLSAPPARDAAGLSDMTRGHLCNGMNQPWLTLPAIAGLAGLYNPALDVSAWLSATLGPSTSACLQRDAALFLRHTREDLLAGQGDRLLHDYGGLGTPAAKEVVAWLCGDYAFDPACLTD